MAPEKTTRRKPAIAMTREDHLRLSKLAESFAMENSPLADELFAELDRARIVAGKLPEGTIRMGSTLRFATDAGEARTVTLVYPGDADITQGRVSVMTPIGIALIGLSPGQSIDWTARDGRRHRLTVESVEPDAAAPHAAGEARRAS